MSKYVYNSDSGVYTLTASELEKRNQLEKIKKEYGELKILKSKPTTVAEIVQRLEKIEQILGL